MPSHRLLGPGRRGRRRGRSLVEPVLARGHRLLIEPLERRGMLSATIAPVGEAVAGDFEGDADTVAAESDEGFIGLPEGVSLLICPVADWTEGDGPERFVPASEPEPDDPLGWDETVTNQDALLDGGDEGAIFWLGAFSPVGFSCGFTADSGIVDWGTPPDMELLLDDSQESTFEPTLDTASGNLPWIEFGTPGEPAAFDAWYEETLLKATTEIGNETDPLLVACDGSLIGTEPDPLLVACDGLFRPREYFSLPLPGEFSPADGEAATSTWRGGVAASFTTAGTDRPLAPVPSASGMPYNSGLPYSWMAAFATNLPGAGVDSTQPVTGRRRSR